MTVYRPNSAAGIDQRREAAEEFLASLGETNGVHFSDIYRENRDAIDAWAARHDFDPRDPRSRETMVREWMYDTGFRPERPGWLKQFIARVRTWLRQHGILVHHLSDDDLQGILARAARAEQKKRRETDRNGGNGEERYALFDNPEKKDRIISAIQKIADGEEEVVVDGLRNDLEQYGGTNDISFCWGNEKKGIYHIAYRRGLNTLLHVIDAVADGKVLRYVNGNKTVILEKDDYEAVLALTEFGKRKSWLLSGWKNNTPDAVGEVGTQSDATQLKPTFSRQELGAGLKNIISQSGEKSSSGNENNAKNPDGNAGTDRNGGVRRSTEDGKKFSVRNVFTGSAADYDNLPVHVFQSSSTAAIYSII